MRPRGGVRYKLLIRFTAATVNRTDNQGLDYVSISNLPALVRVFDPIAQIRWSSLLRPRFRI